MAARNQCYDAGIFGSNSAGVPVISVGNLTAGGTGKTPLVAEIAVRLRARGRRVGIVSRGYGRTTKGPVIVARGDGTSVGTEEAGDEATMLAERFRDAIVVVAEHRVRAAEIAVRELGADVLVMDDGFQHRALRRDLDILVIDGKRDLLREPMLPAGLRREPLSGMARAGLLGVSKLDRSEEVREIGRRLRRWNPSPVFGFRPVVSGIIDLRTASAVNVQRGIKAYIVSGIGDPNGFAATVRGSGCCVAGETAFEDHHRYSAGDIATVISAARSAGAELIATTEKDAVRLRTTEIRNVLHAEEMPFVVYCMRTEVFEGEQHFDNAIAAALAGELTRW